MPGFDVVDGGVRATWLAKGDRVAQAEGTPMQVQAFAGVPLDISDFPSRHPYGLALLQSDFERIPAGWTDELGVQVLRDALGRWFGS